MRTWDDAGEEPVPSPIESPPPNRRDVATAALAAATIPLVRVRTAAASPPPRGFLSPAAFRTLEHLAEQIVPADEHSPGARAAGVAGTIDRWLAELDVRSPDARKHRAAWKAGLGGIDREARKDHRRPYAELGPEAQRALLAGWMDHATAERREFFAALKAKVAWAYYTSEIGIHKDLGYLGNTYSADFEGDEIGPPLAEVFATLEGKGK